MREEKEISIPKPLSAWQKWRKRILLFIGFLVLLPFLISALLHVPFIQNWAVNNITNYLSDRIDEQVEIDYIDFSMFSGLKLDGFDVYTLEKDTIIGTRSLNVSLGKNLLTLINGELSINAIQLVGPRLYLSQEKGEKLTNLQKILKNFSKPKSTGNRKKKEPLRIILEQIDIIDADIQFYDKNTESKINLTSKGLFINVDHINIDSNIYVINDLSMKDMELSIVRGILLDAKSGGYAQPNESKNDTISKPITVPNLNIHRFSLQNGTVELKTDRIKNKSGFDPTNFLLKNIEVVVEDLNLTNDLSLLLNIDNISFEDDKGFKLENLKTKCIEVNSKNIKIPDLILNTEHSYIATTVELNYRNYDALSSIATKTLLKSNLTNSSVALRDILYFLPKNNSPFLKSNINKKIAIEGEFVGRLANLKGNKVKISLPGTLTAVGNFGTRNLNTKNPLINLRMQSLKTSIQGLKNMLPKFKPPKNFEKLGIIDFKGNFDGYLNDFVAYGTLKSDLGLVKTDMRLDLKQGAEQATYSGDITLTDFDLKEWSGNNDFGYISFTGNIRNGKGLTIKNAYADLSGSLQKLEFRNYEYKNININGALNKNKFDGKLSSTDLNLNFGFDGFAELIDNKVTFDFSADVGIIDLQAINLTKERIIFKGNFDFEGIGSSLDDLVGIIDARNLNIMRGDSLYILDSLVLRSSKIDDIKSLDLQFDGSQINMKGNYKFGTIIDDFKSILKNNYPYHTRGWNYTAKTISPFQDVDFDFKLRNNNTLFNIIGIPSSFSADTLFAKGSLNSSKQEISLVTAIPSIAIENNIFKNIFLNFNSKDSLGIINLHLDTTQINTTVLNTFDFNAEIAGDRINFVLNTDEIIDSLQKFEIAGSLKPFKSGYSITINENDIRIYGQRWKINGDNEINIDDHYFDIKNFTITDGSRLIEISDINNKGVRLNVSKFDIELINPILKEDRFYFTGNVFSNVRVADIFQKSPDIYGNILMTNLKINGDSYGELNLDISKPLNRPLDAILSINNPQNGQSIKFNASVDLDNKRVDADLKAKNVPLKILQYLLYKGISDVEGYADIAGTIKGPFDDLKVSTNGMTHNGKVKVLVLGETYSFDKQPFTITETDIDMDGARIYDSQGGEGLISGGLGHTLFKKVYLKASVTGDNVIALNTTKFDNPTYYGLGRGNVSVDFTGDVNYPNILINARTTAGTTINIPIQSTKSASDKSFITFIDKEIYYGDDGDQNSNVVKIDGVSLEMNLIMTPQAKVFLIFDETKGDIIEGTGDGNMQINMNRNGDFDIYGEYEIREGKYLFTALNFINKPFNVREGGKVRWNGDPINATIDIEADYLVRTDLSLFLAEYLVTPALEQAASNRTDVNLQMILGNTLYNPTINFGLNFPDLTGDLKSYADSKVRLLGNNQNDLNNQVFGLIVFNSFLPTNTLSEVLASSSVIQSASVNTLSEFFSNQLSSYVTRFINETLEDNGLISGVDFDINLRNNLTFQGVETNEFSIVPTEIEVKLKNKFRFLDGRLSFDLGGNFVRESLTGINNYIVPEFTFRYALTADRKLNLKVYGKYDLDEISVTNRRQRLGVGLRYRTEFGSMLETKNLISKSIINVTPQVN